jgi:hypothetical protein
MLFGRGALHIGRLSAHILVARAGFGPDDLRLDEYVVRAADHDEMFDIVAPDYDELALAVEIEGIDDAEPHLPRAPAGHAEATAECKPKHKQNEHGGNEERHRGGADH